MTTCTSQHPDLFGFVIARVGRINMLTSHKYTPVKPGPLIMGAQTADTTLAYHIKRFLLRSSTNLLTIDQK